MEPKNKVILIIRDGWGYKEEKKGNAIMLAQTPNEDFMEKNCPKTLLGAHGSVVGLPENAMGGSEVGHFTIGAGKVFFQPYERINRSIKDRSFFRNEKFIKALNHARKNNSKIHLMGLFSDEGVHGTTMHVYALMEFFKQNSFENVFVHAFLDGRDVPEKSAKRYFEEFNSKAKELGLGKIASIAGRYYAMDRDTNYDRTEKAYNLLVKGKGFNETDAFQALENAYARGDSTDYYVKPIVLTENEKPVALIEKGDAVIFWNFRTDRARQITRAFIQESFNEFSREKVNNLYFLCFSEYDSSFNADVAFEEIKVDSNLGKIISENNLKQLRVAETEKYAHVTFFFNSQEEKPFPGEDRILVPSPKVPSYAEKPEMSAYKITDKLVPAIKSGNYDFILVNFANGDLVGHSADLKATIKCCEVVDECVSKILDAAKDYVVLVTADHGNAEEMLYPDGEPNPAHGNNPVRFFVCSQKEEFKNLKLKNGLGLSSIASTVLKILGIEKPKEFDEPIF